MSPDPPLGTVISPCDERLFRQIHPEKFSKGKPGVINFVPVPGKSNFMPEDNYNLSTRREALTAQGAYEAHVSAGLASAGTWAVTVQDAAEVHEDVLPVYDDEGLGTPPAPEKHATIRFPDVISNGQRESIARKLWRRAQGYGDDGWVYRP